MPLYTDHYRLWVIQNGEPLDPLEDSKRFMTIDRQLLGLYEVFGNGVISGWDVTAAGGLSVSISPGTGYVYFMSAETTTPVLIDDLVASSNNYIYAQVIDETRYYRDVRLFSSNVPLLGGYQIPLALVTTSSSAVVNIDSSIRTNISFIEAVKQLVNQHKHLGGSENPTKVDLSSEVYGQLPSYRIGTIDASSITSGRIPASRFPLFNHSDLKDSGVLTHPQLDTFVRSLTNPNARLLGELSGTNLMQLYLAHKHYWNEIDKYSYNLITMIPGITPDDQTDFAATTAIVDTYNHSIQGIKSTQGSLYNTTFSTLDEFNNAPYRSNIDIFESTVPFGRLSRPVTETIVENFDDVFQTDITVPNWTIDTIASSSTTSFKTDSAQSVDGSLSGQLFVNQGTRLRVTKIFTTAANWQDYNEIELYVETASAVNHGIVKLEVLSGTTSNPTTLFEVDLFSSTNEVTNGFKKIVFDISSYGRNNIIGIRIYTDTLYGWDLSAFTMNIDKIMLNNNLFFVSEGRIRFRYKTPQPASWISVNWDGDTNGGLIESRARVASSYEVFDGSTISTFTPYYSVAYNPSLEANRCVEVEIKLSADPSLTASPELRSVTISYLTAGADDSIVIDTLEEFDRYTLLDGTKTAATPDRVDLYSISIGNTTYSQNRNIYEYSGITIPTATDGTLPYSPWQAIQTSPTRSLGFDYAYHVERLSSQRYLVADTMNDRVLIVSNTGSVLSGLYSNNAGTYYYTSYKSYPSTVVYNRALSRLQITFAWPVNDGGLDPIIDITKITLVGPSFSKTLSTEDTILTIPGVTNYASSTTLTHSLSIELGDSSRVAINDYLDNSGTLYLSVVSTLFKYSITQTNSNLDLSNSNYLTLVDPGVLLLKVVVSNMILVDGIIKPVCVSITPSNRWLIGNSKKWSEDLERYNSSSYSPVFPWSQSKSWEKSASPLSTSSWVSNTNLVSIIEFDQEGEPTYTYNNIEFSISTIGTCYMLDDTNMIIAGLYPLYSYVTPSYGLTTNYYGSNVRIIDRDGISSYNLSTQATYWFADVQYVTEAGIDYIYTLQKYIYPYSGAVTSRIRKYSVTDFTYTPIGTVDPAQCFNDLRVYDTNKMILTM